MRGRCTLTRGVARDGRPPPGTRRTGRLGLIAVVATAPLLTTGCNPGAAEARELDVACSDGDATACNRLGWRVRQGEQVLADWRRAAALFERACDGGEAEGCVRLARLRLHRSAEGRGITPDTASAVDLFQRGCAAGAAVGCTDLATLHIDRTEADTTGTTDLYGLAAPLYERACDEGDLKGCTLLGTLHDAGHGVETDVVRAAALHRRACDGGSLLGCAHFGRSLELGSGVEADIARAAGLYERACEEEMTGCFRLAGLHWRGAGVEQDIERAAELFDQACDGTVRRDEGSPPVAESCFRIAEMIVDGEIDRPLWRASSYFRAACRLGYDDACGRS